MKVNFPSPIGSTGSGSSVAVIVVIILAIIVLYLIYAFNEDFRSGLNGLVGLNETQNSTAKQTVN